MAGESPDKSEQRKSPGEAASGEPRDPRLAAFGDAESPDGDAKPAAGPTVDQSTAVFRAPVPVPASASAEEESVESGMWNKSDRSGESDADSGRRTAEADEADDAADAATSEPAGKAEPAAKATDVDQPTAVFNAFQRRSQSRPPVEPPVDQATTALKVVTPEPQPAAAKPAPKWAAAESEARTGGDAERTSTFVPLRSDDVRPAAGSVGVSTMAEKTGSASAPSPASPVPASLTEAERTKQQPMPPRPPLDMLAELTNTPPPPDTPVRTLVRRLKIWTPLVLLLAIIFATVQLLRPLPEPALRLSTDASYTFEGGKLEMPWPGEGQGAVEVEGVGVIGTYGPQKPAPTASVAKTMTAYVILKSHPIDDKDAGPQIEIDQLTEEQASNPDWSVAPVKKGQTYTQGELLQLLMIPSANNVAHLLARWDAGSEEAFIRKMNDAAKELGMTNTTYTDPSGFEKTTVSTPTDQLKLAKAVMQFKAFREIVDMPNVNLPQIGKQLENGNTILLKDGVSGIKTGTSTPAGGNLLWAAYTKVDGKLRRVLGVVMGVKTGNTLHEKATLAIQTYSYDLIRTAQDGVTSATVFKEGDVVAYVDDGLGSRTPVVVTKDLKPVGWAGLTVELTLTDGGKGLPGEAPEGTVIGEIAVGAGDGRVSVPVALQRDLSEPGFGTRLTRLG